MRNFALYTLNIVWLQKGLAGAVSLALPLELFYKNTHDAYPTRWTYIEDELFIPMRPELKKDIGQCVSTKQCVSV